MSTTDKTIPDTMKSVTCYGPQDYRLEDKPVPICGPDDILIRSRACGICAGDSKCFAGNMMFWGDDKRAPYVQPPVTAGHEFVGEIVAMGDKAALKYDGELKIGDACVSEQIAPCWECMYCKKGLSYLCAPHDIYGFHQRTQGGMAEYMLYPAGSVNHKLPRGIDWELLAFTEPLSCALHGIDRANIRFGDTVVVSGCGPIGLGMIAGAKAKSPERVIALDLNPKRLEVAKLCGADICLNPKDEDVVAAVKKITGQYGCDVYMEATGHPVSVEQGLHMCRKQANFVEFSVFAQKTTVDWTIIGDTKELNIFGAHLSGLNGYRQAIKMITQGFDLVDQGSESIKVVMQP